MKKIVIDMDDVICGDGFLNLVNKFLNTNYTQEDIKGYYIQDLVPKNKMEEWDEYFKKHNLYEYVNIIQYADEVIEKLNKFYDVYVLSAYIQRDIPEFSGQLVKDKYDWLYKNLPFLNPEKFIFTSSKEIIECDIRIDDRLSNLEGKAGMKLLFSSYHNKEYSKKELEEKGVIRVNSWKEIEKLLLK